MVRNCRIEQQRRLRPAAHEREHVVAAGHQQHAEEGDEPGGERRAHGVLPGEQQHVVEGAVTRQRPVQPRHQEQRREDEPGQDHRRPEDRRDEQAADLDVPAGHHAHGALEPAHVPVRLRRGRRVPRPVRAVEPHRVDLHEGAERGADAGDQQEVAGGAQGVGRHHRRADDGAVAPSRPRELRVPLQPEQAEVRAEQAGDGRRQQEDVHRVDAGDEAAGRELAAEQQRGQRRPHERDRLRDGEGDAQAGAREQVVGQRVAHEPVQADEDQQGDADEPVDAARPPVRRREATCAAGG